jgi:hypothetical protein
MATGDISIPPNLTNLHLDIIDDVTNSAISFALHRLPHLRSLRLPRCGIYRQTLLPLAKQLTSLTFLELYNVDFFWTWVNELPSLSGLSLHDWNDDTAQQLHCRHLTSFDDGSQAVAEYPSIWPIFEYHTQLQQLSMHIDRRNWPSLEGSFLTSLRFTCTRRASELFSNDLPGLASTSLCELSLWNAIIPIETWNLMTSSIWPNLTMMDITRTHDNEGNRPIEWMTAAMNSK